MDAWTGTPAFVLNPAMDLLASNTLVHALFSPFRPADNLARMTFLDPAARDLFTDRTETTGSVVAGLRRASDLYPEYRRLRSLVRELSATSEEFARLWSSHTVHGKSSAAKNLIHSEAGRPALTYQTFEACGAPGQQLGRFFQIIGSLDLMCR
ncbi:hypothetical protein [Kitasatospora albolonga]|uniref:MmyB family transcriptional regulator n=1 Tax=Kitasatospora albolonga TaxID=68173 RepID=UPI0031F0B5E1